MARLTYDYTDPRWIAGVDQVRKIHNERAAADAAAKNPPEVFAPLTRDQYLSMVLDSALASWAERYADEIDEALAPAEAANFKAAKAALIAKTGRVVKP